MEILKHNIFKTILTSLLITSIFISMDILYSLSNNYFIFIFTKKEFFFKMFILIFLILLIQKRKVRITIYLILIVFSFFQYIHFEYFGKNISAIEFYLFSNNIHETFETLTTVLNIVFTPFLIATVSFCAIFIIDLKTDKYLFRYKYASSIFIIGFLLISFRVFYLTNIKKGILEHSQSKLIYPITNRHSSRNFFISLDYFLFGVLHVMY